MYRAKSWNTGAIWARTSDGSQPARSTPSHAIDPRVGGSRSHSSLASVVLPDPLAPTIAMICPRRSSKLTLRTASSGDAGVPVAEVGRPRAPSAAWAARPVGRRSRMTGKRGPEALEVAEERHALVDAAERRAGRLEPAAELLQADDGDGRVADRDRAAAGEDQRERERRDEHRRRDERPDRRQRRAGGGRGRAGGAMRVSQSSACQRRSVGATS